MSVQEAKERRKKIGLWLVITPPAVLIGSLVLYALSNWVLASTAPPVGGGSVLPTIINIILFIASAAALSLGLPSIIIGIVLLATQPASAVAVQKPVVATTASPQKGFSIAGMVLGICSVVLFWVGGFVLGILAIIFSALGLKRKAATGLAVTGLVTGIVGTLLSIVMGMALIIASYAGIQATAHDSMVQSQAYSVQKYAELFSAENGVYPSLLEVREMSAARGDTFTIGHQESSEDIMYVPCYGDGAIIWYWNSESEEYETLYVGDTNSCELGNWI